jgi:hypothetical protein
MRRWIKLILLGLLIFIQPVSSPMASFDIFEHMELLVEDAVWPGQFLVKEGYLYWSEMGDSAIRRVPVSGGPVATLARKVVDPRNMVLSAENVYWIESRPGVAPSGCIGAIWILNKTSVDGATTVLARSRGCGGTPADLVVTDKNIYWLDSTWSPNTYYIMKVPLIGGDGETILTTMNEIQAVAGDATHLYWIEQDTEGPHIVKKMSYEDKEVTVVYTSNNLIGRLALQGSELALVKELLPIPSGYRILKVQKSGGAAVTLAETTGVPLKLVTEGANVYWIDDQGVYSVPLEGGSTKVLASVTGSPYTITADSGSVYWAESTTHDYPNRRINRVSVNGGNVQSLVEGIHTPVVLSTDSTDLYWVEGGGDESFGRIARIPLSGGPITTIVSGIEGNSPHFTITGDMIYVSDHPYIKKVPITGGTVERFLYSHDGAWDVTTEEGFLYWIQGEGGGGDSHTTIRKMDIDQGLIEILTTILDKTGLLRVLNGYAYWSVWERAIRRVSVDGGDVTTIVADRNTFITDYVLDNDYVYFAEWDTGNINRVSVGGGPVSVFGGGGPMFSPYYLAIDDSNLYWIGQVRVGLVTKAGWEGLPSSLITPAGEYLRPSGIASDGEYLYIGLMRQFSDEGAIVRVKISDMLPLSIDTLSLPEGEVGIVYSASLKVVGGTPPYTTRVSQGVLPSGLKLTSYGKIEGTPVGKGGKEFSISVLDQDKTVASRRFKINIYGKPAIATTNISKGKVGTPFSFVLKVKDGKSPFTWSLNSGNLPDGLSLDAATGSIAGVPIKAGNFSFTVRVSDSLGGINSKNLKIKIN